MIKEATELVGRISGRRGKNCYCVLCRAVTVVVRYLPEEPQMKTICAETAQICGKGVPAVWKALSRAVDDLWEHGDREELERVLGHLPQEKPSPRDVVLLLACKLWCDGMQMGA